MLAVPQAPNGWERTEGGLLCARRKAPGYGRRRRGGYGQGYGDRGYGRRGDGGGGGAGNTHSLSLARASSQYAGLAGGLSSALAGTFSVETWLYFATLPSTSEIWSVVGEWTTSGNQRQWLIDIQESAGSYNLRFFVDTTGNFSAVYQATWSGISISAETWIHLAITYDSGLAASAAAKGYRNAVALSSPSVIGSTGSPLAGTADYRIGATDVAGRSFNGDFDDTRIWTDVRTPTEISDNYQTELAGNETGLLAYHKHNDDAGADATANSNTLTLQNGASYATSPAF